MLFHRGCFINVRHSTKKNTNVQLLNNVGVKLQGGKNMSKTELISDSMGSTVQ